MKVTTSEILKMGKPFAEQLTDYFISVQREVERAIREGSSPQDVAKVIDEMLG